MQIHVGMEHKNEQDTRMENSLSRVGISLSNISVLIQDLFKSQISDHPHRSALSQHSGIISDAQNM